MRFLVVHSMLQTAIEDIWLNLQEFIPMIKKFIPVLLCATALCGFSAQKARAEEMTGNDKAMQTRSYELPEDVKRQLIENIKKNQGEKEDGSSQTAEQASPSPAPREEIGGPAKRSKDQPENKIWQKYKALAAGVYEEGQEQQASEQEEDDYEDEETTTADSQQRPGGMAGILQSYQSRNNTQQMQTRSFSTPEDIADKKHKSEESEDQSESDEEKPKQETKHFKKVYKTHPKKTKKKKTPFQVNG